jgi:hypothetical protein
VISRKTGIRDKLTIHQAWRRCAKSEIFSCRALVDMDSIIRDAAGKAMRTSLD